MKLKNISKEEQKVLPHIGQSFAVAPGEMSPELDTFVAADLLTSFPSVWEPSDVKPSKKPKSKES